MMHIVRLIIDTLFPPPAACAAIAAETPEQFLRHYAPATLTAHAVALMSYGTPAVRSAISANKFHRDQHAARLLGHVMTHWLHSLPLQPTVIAPIPLGHHRLRHRGHNQVHTILRHTSLPHHITLTPDLLRRTRETKEQSKLSKAERMQNMHAAFVWNPRHDTTLFSGKRIIIVDDVITTGATMQAARAALLTQLPPDAEILGVGLSH